MLAVERAALSDGASERIAWHQGQRLVAEGDRTIELSGGGMRRSQDVEDAGVPTVGEGRGAIRQLNVTGGAVAT
jgi:hypothetical protein